MSLRCVDIVLATYNGAQYLPEQLDSLLNQTESFASIIVSDDGSTDRTLSIIREFKAKYPVRIRLLEPASSQGACANFDYLLSASEADYVCLADQDDIWDVDKLNISLEKMIALESEYGSEMPLLVHSDLRVVDQELNLIASSFFEMQHLLKRRDQFKGLLLQNTVTGCTVLVNRALLRKALPIPGAARMHDWWLALVAAAFGKIGFVDQATISYRQHGRNTVGARGWSIRFVFSRLYRLMSRKKAANLLRPVFLQGLAFLECYGKSLDPEKLKVLSAFVGIMDQAFVSRMHSALKHRFNKHGVLRTIAFYWALLIVDFDD